MKQVIILFFAVAANLCGRAQNVGIGTAAPDASSKLEITSDNSGLLIPRLTAIQRMAITNPANGLLVFDTDSAAFAYRTGSAWLFIKATNSNANDWSTGGNTGTTAANFIGTTDAQPLRFKVKNANAGLIDSASYNTAFGYRALDSAKLGAYNSAFGYNALLYNSTGNFNTANGVDALGYNSTGWSNTANGARALGYNNTGSYNTANGVEALRYNNTGSYNTANGYQALLSNTTGGSNSANGYRSLYSNTTGTGNAANGLYSLYSNTTGSYNAANGYYSLYANTTGSNNTASGVDALFSNITGNSNTAIGNNSLHSNTSGSYNTASGTAALNNTTTAYYNTALGYYAGGNYVNGYNNVFLGANTDVNGTGYFNVIAIGQGTICTASSQVTMGNSSTGAYRAYANWSNISDGRFKNNIQENVPGLSFINKLRPVTYKLAATALDEFYHRNHKDSLGKKGDELKARSLKEKEQITYTGFIAQDVEAAAKSLGFDFSGVDAPKNENDTYGLRYAEFVVPLVKAVQEQQQQIEALKKEIQLLKEKSGK